MKIYPKTNEYLEGIEEFEKTLKEYKGIEIPKVEYKVEEKDIEHELGHMAEKNARIVTVEDRPVEKNDITVIDFEGFVDGKAFEGGKAENYELTIGSNSFIPGFEDQIIGMKIDEEKDIKVKFPEEYFSKELAGKDATFKIKLHEIKKKEMPEINDELAKDISEFDTIDELKKSIRESKEKQNETQAKYETEDDAIEAVCKNAKVEIPSGMIETEIENMEKDMESRLSYQGMKLDDYLQIMGKTREQFKEEYKPQAEKQVKSRLVLEAIADDAKIEVTEEEIQAKIEEMAKMLKTSKEEITLAMESYNPVESIHSSAYNKDGDEICILDRLSTNIDEETQIVNKISIKQLIEGLEDREKQIILLRYYKSRTQSQVAKILGITQVQVSRLEKQILETMKKKICK